MIHDLLDGKTKYMGICKLNSKSKGRRMDIRFIPYESKVPAILYFTGSGNFNKFMAQILPISSPQTKDCSRN